MTQTTERLEQRLESVQEGIYEAIEEQSDRLPDQIKFWELIRKEQALLYMARKNKIMKIGMEVVPPMSVSEARAKEAIQMSMYLNSLSKSKYAKEPWTMQNTSRERLLAPPKFCFKKDGKPVDLIFDGNPSNSMRETLWGWIYYQDNKDQWQKQPGEVDKEGLFYRDYDNSKQYYVSFKELADKYSKEGSYRVIYNSKIIADVIDITSHSDFRSPATAPPKETQIPGPVSRRGRVSRRGTSPSPHPAAPGPSSSSARSRSSGRAPAATAPTPRQVGTSHTSITGPTGSRLRRLLLEAHDPPALILTGNPNTVKCLRFRLRHRYAVHFEHLTTSWWWAGDGREKSRDASMLVSFKSDEQRAKFLNVVPVPSTVRVAAASLFFKDKLSY